MTGNLEIIPLFFFTKNSYDLSVFDKKGNTKFSKNP